MTNELPQGYLTPKEMTKRLNSVATLDNALEWDEAIEDHCYIFMDLAGMSYPGSENDYTDDEYDRYYWRLENKFAKLLGEEGYAKRHPAYSPAYRKPAQHDDINYAMDAKGKWQRPNSLI